MYAEGGVNKHAIVIYKNINKIFIIIVIIIYFLFIFTSLKQSNFIFTLLQSNFIFTLLQSNKFFLLLLSESSSNQGASIVTRPWSILP